ncbi:hypothetical protein STLA111740_10320 [Stenotrophomonas lactitubi]
MQQDGSCSDPLSNLQGKFTGHDIMPNHCIHLSMGRQLSNRKICVIGDSKEFLTRASQRNRRGSRCQVWVNACTTWNKAEQMQSCRRGKC